MLNSLSIRNYALITQLDVEFRAGLNMITGETGAGKSILLGALSLLLGNRADSQVLKDKEKKCLVEGVFDLTGLGLESLFEGNDLDYGNPAFLRREINPQGKSRAFINDTPVNLNVLRDIGSRLVDIHSQHQNLLLADPEFALHVIDQYGRLGELNGRYRQFYADYRRISQELTRREEILAKARQDQDYLEFQVSQLTGARLQPGELEALEQEQLMLEHAGEIRQQLAHAVEVLNESDQSVLTSLKQILSGLHSVSAFFPEISDPMNRLQAAYVDIQDITRELSGMQDESDTDPERLSQVIDRIDLLNTLLKKHQASGVGELLGLLSAYEERLALIRTSDDEIAGLRAELGGLTESLSHAAADLSEGRKRVIPGLQEAVTGLIRDLGMPGGKFEIGHSVSERYSQDGIDNLTFLFSANRNIDTLELSEVASGGESSRLMLSIKSLVSASMSMPTVIFDEIDTGVSGDIADRVGNLIQRISKGRQVLNITHLPQVASKGDYHYKVFKFDDLLTTHTSMKLLSQEERVAELAQMLSGESITPEAVENARVLLQQK